MLLNRSEDRPQQIGRGKVTPSVRRGEKALVAKFATAGIPRFNHSVRKHNDRVTVVEEHSFLFEVRLAQDAKDGAATADSPNSAFCQHHCGVMAGIAAGEPPVGRKHPVHKRGESRIYVPRYHLPIELGDRDRGRRISLELNGEHALDPCRDQRRAWPFARDVPKNDCQVAGRKQRRFEKIAANGTTGK